MERRRHRNPISQLNDEYLLEHGSDANEEVVVRPTRRIYRVPPSIRAGGEEEYEPKLVSLGPYHFGKPHLKAYEAHKCKTLIHCLGMAGKDLLDIEDAVWEIIVELQSYYDKLDAWWFDHPQDFVRVMVVDGCFLLQLVRPAWGPSADYPFRDPIFRLQSRAHNYIDLLDDMMLLENQLPFELLELLFHELLPDNIPQPATGPDFWQMEARWIFQSIYSDLNPTQLIALESALHPLDYITSTMLIISDKTALQPVSSTRNSKSAAELSEHGVQFKVVSDGTIDFNYGIIRVPFTVINYRTKRKLLNAIAYERLRGGDTMATAYVLFMASLMKTPEDVNMLCEEGIIWNKLDSPQAVVDIYNTISHGLIDFGRHHEAIIHQIDAYCGTKLRSCRAYLKRTYFRSPWAMLSLVYALILFLFTLGQTFYTIAGHYSSTGETHPK